MQLGLAAKSAEELPVGAGSETGCQRFESRTRGEERKAETILVKVYF